MCGGKCGSTVDCAYNTATATAATSGAGLLAGPSWRRSCHGNGMIQRFMLANHSASYHQPRFLLG